MAPTHTGGDRRTGEIDRILQALVQEGKAHSYAYGIFDRTGLIHAGSYGTIETMDGAYGNADARLHDQSAEHLRFRIASMSKSFTAAAILKLDARHQLALHEPITSIIPEMANVAAYRDDAFAITIADLLAMRSGLATDDAWADRQESMTHEAFESLLSHGFNTVFAPGEGYEYSNVGYAVLGEVIHRITGRQARAYIDEEFLRPLALQETTYDYRQVDPSLLVRGHHFGYDRRWHPEDFSAPGAFSTIGGVLSTVHDIVRWARWLSAGFADRPREAADDDQTDAQGGEILPRRYRRLMQTGHTPIPPIIRTGSSRGWLTHPDRPRIESYGYGLAVEHNPRYGDIALHSGGYPGYGSHMRWHLDSGVGIVVLADGRYSSPGVVASRALDVLLQSAPQGSCAMVDAAIAGRSFPLWQRTKSAMDAVNAMLRSICGSHADAEGCRAGLEQLKSWFSMNIELDSALCERATRLADIFAATGPVVDAATPETAHSGTAESPAQVSWTLACERHPLRCSIRMNPLLPPQIESLEFEMADAVKTDDVAAIMSGTRILD